MTYAVLHRQIVDWVESLNRMGIGRRDRVALALPVGDRQLTAILGTCAGAQCIPLNPVLPAHEFEYLFEALSPALLITANAVGNGASRAARSRSIPILDLSGQYTQCTGGLTLTASGCRPCAYPGLSSIDDVALILTTSGSTARPKLVPLRWRNIEASLRNMSDVLALQHDDRMLSLMPTHHILGASTAMAALRCCGSVLFPSRPTVDAIADAFITLAPTWYSASPALHHRVLEGMDPAVARRVNLRFVRSASAPLEPALQDDLERVFNAPVIQAYGMTEASPQIASNRLPPCERKPGSVGTAAGPEIRVVDEFGETLPPGSRGEIAIRGENVFDGYIGVEPAERTTFRDGWFLTEDLGYLDEDGYLYITGRKRGVINRGGEKIAARKITEAMERHPAVISAQTHAAPHPVLGEEVVVSVVARREAGEAATLVDSLKAHAAAHLSHFELPAKISIASSNATDAAAQMPFADQEAVTYPSDQFRSASPTVKVISEMWADVLGIREFDVDDNFFSLGGDSLRAAKVVSEIEERFCVAIAIERFVESPTISTLAIIVAGELADLVAGDRLRVHPSAPPDDRPSHATAFVQSPTGTKAGAASIGQQRLWFLDRLGAGAAYNMNASLMLKGYLDLQVFEACVNDLVRRHDTLRTVFRQSATGIEQVVTPFNAIDLDLVDLSREKPNSVKRKLVGLATREAARPFDLSAGPLFRCQLIRLGDEHHALLLIMHHSISDGWSSAVLHRELALLYQSRCAGAEPPSLPSAMQFSDYTKESRRWIGSVEYDRQLHFWKQKLQDMPAMTSFPTDMARPHTQGFRGARYNHVLSDSLSAALGALGARENATLFVLLFSAFVTLVHRYNRQDLCVIGVPVANRRRPDMDTAVGFYVNTLAIPADLSGNPLFRDLLGVVRKTVAEAMDHQELPFSKLVDELIDYRNPSHSPLFQLQFVMQEFPDARLAGAEVVEPTARIVGAIPGEFPDLEDGVDFRLGPELIARRFPIDNGTTKFDMTLHVHPSRGGGVALSWQYSTDLFDPGTVHAVASHYEALLRAIIDNPDDRVRDLRFVARSGPWRGEQVPPGREHPVPISSKSFVERFRFQVARVPNRSAVCLGERRISYRQLDEKVDDLAKQLGLAGVGPLDVVAIECPRSIETVIAILAIWKSGAAYAPIDFDDPPSRIRLLIEDCGAGYFLTTESNGKLEGAFGATVSLVTCSQGETSFFLHVLTDSHSAEPDMTGRHNSIGDRAYIMYTSGSAGRPKRVVITHGELGRYIGAMVDALELDESDICFHAAPFTFSSSVRQFALPLAVGATVVIGDSATVRDPLLLLDCIQRSRVTVIDLIPSRWRTLLGSLHDNGLMGAFSDCRPRLVLSASQRLTIDLAARLLDTFAYSRIINMYGQTETSGIVCTHVVNRKDMTASSIPIGRPLRGIHVSVMDENMNPTPPGGIGELCIHADTDDPHFTRSHLVNDVAGNVSPEFHESTRRIHHTNDLVRYRPDGNLEFIGRNDRQLKIRGMRIDPEDVETALRQHPLVADALVVASAKPPGEGLRTVSRLVAYVEAKPDGRSTSSGVEGVATTVLDDSLVSGLRHFLVGALPRYLVPAIKIVATLPRTRSGKPDPIALPAEVDRGEEAWSDSGESHLQNADPGSPQERILAAIWRRVLGVERLRSSDGFFDLGGDSLLSVQVVDQARQAGLDITLENLFSHQRLGDLARLCANVDTGDRAPTISTSGDSVTVVVAVDNLREYGREALRQAGLDSVGVEIVAEVQLEASLRGQSTHDMVSIPRYARRIAAGLINPRPEIRIESTTPVSARIDGDNGPGAWVAVSAMETAIRLCRTSGIGMVGVRRSNHFGAAGHYAWLAGLEGFIGLCTTNGPVLLAPTGGVTPTFGNNPLAVCIPAASYPPILMDVTMSVAPRGKIGLKLSEGESIPSGWILDSRGMPSTDLADLAAGLGVPIGGHKGYALALVMEVLAGVLTGAAFGHDHKRNQIRQNAAAPDIGHFFLAIDPRQLYPGDDFTTRVDKLIEQTKSSARMEDIKTILMPGERELQKRAHSLVHGVSLRLSTFEHLQRYASQAHLSTVLTPIQAR